MKDLIRWLRVWSPRRKFFVSIAAVTVVLDQLSKYWAVAALTGAFRSYGGSELSGGEQFNRFLWFSHPVPAGDVEVISGLWRFRYAENPGAAWSFLAQSPDWFRAPFFLLVSVVAMVFIVVYYRRAKLEQRALRWALALVFGGALGNVLDRARLGYVIDFIQWHWHDRVYWPTFNVADAAITSGVALMVLDMLLEGRWLAGAKRTS